MRSVTTCTCIKKQSIFSNITFCQESNGSSEGAVQEKASPNATPDNPPRTRPARADDNHSSGHFLLKSVGNSLDACSSMYDIAAILVL